MARVYEVSWTMSIEADSPEEAAQLARNAQRDYPEHFFDITNEAGALIAAQVQVTDPAEGA